MIKKIIIGALAFVLAASLVACDKNNDSKKDNTSAAEATTTTVATTEEAKTEEVTTKASKPAGINAEGEFVSEYGYSMDIPEGWEETILPGALEALMDADGNNVIFATLPSDASFKDADEEYFRMAFSTLGEAVTFLGFKETNNSGYEGFRVDITNKVSDTMTAIQTQLYFEVDDTVYLFTFTDMDGSNQDVIKGIIDSISID